MDKNYISRVAVLLFVRLAAAVDTTSLKVIVHPYCLPDDFVPLSALCSCLTSARPSSHYGLKYFTKAVMQFSIQNG